LYFFYALLRSFSLRCDCSELIVFLLRFALFFFVAVRLLGTDSISFTFRAVLSCYGAISWNWLYFFFTCSLQERVIGVRCRPTLTLSRAAACLLGRDACWHETALKTTASFGAAQRRRLKRVVGRQIDADTETNGNVHRVFLFCFAPFFLVAVRLLAAGCIFLRIAPSFLVVVRLLRTDCISFTFRSVLSCCGAISQNWLYFFYVSLGYFSLRCDFSELIVFLLRFAPSCVVVVRLLGTDCIFLRFAPFFLVAVRLLGTDCISFTFRAVLSRCGRISRSWLYFFTRCSSMCRCRETAQN
jgi:hypothetical protein